MSNKIAKKTNTAELSKSFQKMFGYNYYTTDGSIVEEPFTGAWQRNIIAKQDSAIENSTYFACLTLIANDISKLDMVVKKRLDKKTDIYLPAFERKYRWLSDLLEFPNETQNSQDFFARWVHSLNQKGNTICYIDKENNIPVGLYILDPDRVQILRGEDGSVFYKVLADRVIGTRKDFTFTSDQIIHHRINTLFDDLVGVPPLIASAIQVYNSIEQGKTALDFYRNAARPSGLLIAPHDISQEEVDSLKVDMKTAMQGRQNAGRLFVISGGVQYQQLSTSAADQQMIEQLKFNTEAICATFHVPPYMVSGNAPSYSNIEALSQEYFQKALQFIIVGIEKNLYRGLKLKDLDDDIWIEFDLKNLLRMDQSTRYKVYGEAIGKSFLTINEVRAQEDLAPIEGGDTVYMQQQNYSLAAIAERDKNSPLLVKPDTSSSSTSNNNADEVPPDDAAPSDNAVDNSNNSEEDNLKHTLSAIDFFNAIEVKFIEDEGLLKISLGDLEKTLRVPSVQYKGVFKEDEEYIVGNYVTCKGSLWICKKDTKEKPGTSKDWQLCAKGGK